MPYEVRNPQVVGNFLRGRQAAQEEQSAGQVNALRGMQLQREQRLNALAPDATPEQYVRAGDAQTGAALSSMQRQGQMDKQQAVQQLGALAQKALSITDPAQRKSFLAQAQQIYGPAFTALGADLSKFPEMLAMPDDQLAQKLAEVAQFAPAAQPREMAPGASLVTQGPGGFETAYTAPIAPKDNAITPYQQAQLDLDRQRLEQGKSGNAIQLQGVTGKLRDDYTQIVKSTGWPSQQGFYQRMKSVGNDGTGASDLALVFSFMKVLDPDSAVREGEYANAQNTAGIPGWVTAQYNKALSGEILAPDQRKKFIDTADKIYATGLKRQEAIRSDFTGKATRAGVNPQDVLVDFGASPAAPDQTAAAPAQDPNVPTATGPNGQKIYFRNGQWGP